MLLLLKVLLIIVSIVLIIGVLMQSGSDEGLGALGGGMSSLMGSQGRSLDAFLGKVTTVTIVLFMVLALAIAAIQ